MSIRAWWRRSRAPLRIVTRQSPDWRNTPHDALIEGSRAFCRMVGAEAGFGENFIADIVAVWDRTFALPYFELRALMKDIAQRNLREIGDATVIPLDDQAGADTRAQLHLFIDDDDWLHPQLWQELQPCLDGADGYVFGNILCLSTIELRRLEDGCYTNNYAVSGSWLRARADGVSAVAQHWGANAVFHAAGFRRSYVPRYVSATNKHPASAMRLKFGLKHAPLCEQTLRNLVSSYVVESRAAQLPPAAAWVQPYLLQVRRVFEQL